MGIYSDLVSVESYMNYQNSNYGAHTMLVRIGDMSIYFSYSTVVGFATPEDGRIVSDNVWSVTTSRHKGRVGGRRVPHDEFVKLYEQALVRHVMPPKDALRKRVLELAAG
jgi:hypothetical protein